MLKRLLLASALVLGWAASASAQETPASTDECFKMSMELFKTADEKKIADDKRSRVEELLEKMESHCDAKQFGEAAGIAKDVKAVIGQ